MCRWLISALATAGRTGIVQHVFEQHADQVDSVFVHRVELVTVDLIVELVAFLESESA